MYCTHGQRKYEFKRTVFFAKSFVHVVIVWMLLKRTLRSHRFPLLMLMKSDCANPNTKIGYRMGMYLWYHYFNAFANPFISLLRWNLLMIKKQMVTNIPMGKWNKDVIPLATHWSYVFIILTHRFLLCTLVDFKMYIEDPQAAMLFPCQLRQNTCLSVWHRDYFQTTDRSFWITTHLLIWVTKVYPYDNHCQI